MSRPRHRRRQSSTRARGTRRIGHASPPALVLALLWLLGVPGAARPTVFVNVDDAALARAADLVLDADVLAVESVERDDGAVVTLAYLGTREALRGPAPALLAVRQPGGDAGDHVLRVVGAPEWREGDHVLAFLTIGADGVATPTFLSLGVYVFPTPGTSRAWRSPGADVRGDATLSPSLSLDEARRLVATSGSARGSLPAALSPPAEVTAPASRRRGRPRFTLTEPPARWREADQGIPVLFSIDPAGDKTIGPADSLTAVEAAMAAWTSAEGASITLDRGADAPPAPLVCDGLSQLIFNDPYGEIAPPVGCSGVLALGGYCSREAAHVVGGVVYQEIAEGNVTFADGFDGCPDWTKENLAEVVTHELGHAIGLGHSSEVYGEPNPTLADATMFFMAHFDGRGACLHSDDLAAVRTVYPEPDPDGGHGDGGGCIGVAMFDDDGDGVHNGADACAMTAAGAVVDGSGCSCDQKACNDGDACTVDACAADTATCSSDSLLVSCLGGGTPCRPFVSCRRRRPPCARALRTVLKRLTRPPGATRNRPLTARKAARLLRAVSRPGCLTPDELTLVEGAWRGIAPVVTPPPSPQSATSCGSAADAECDARTGR